MSAVEFDAFVRANLPRLLRYALMLTGDRELAQDLVQDVLVKAHGRWSKVGATDRPDRYVSAMVVNAYLSWRRRWSVRHVLVTDEVPEVAVEMDDGSDRADIWQRLATLSRNQRAAIVLRYYEGLPDAEIAQVMGCSAPTVRVHIHRALKALRLDYDAAARSVPTSSERT